MGRAPGIIVHLSSCLLKSSHRTYVQDYALFAEAFRELGGTWVMKPSGSAEGRGIFLFNKLSDVKAWAKPHLIRFMRRSDEDCITAGTLDQDKWTNRVFQFCASPVRLSLDHDKSRAGTGSRCNPRRQDVLRLSRNLKTFSREPLTVHGMQPESSSMSLLCQTLLQPTLLLCLLLVFVSIVFLSHAEGTTLLIRDRTWCNVISPTRT